MIDSQLPIHGQSSAAWAQNVLKNFELFLLDHASCERKAAALAMSFISKYSDRKFLIEPMVSLAREELEHFAQVYRLLTKRGIIHLPPDEPDSYVNFMLKRIRHGREEHFLDRLIVSAMIEARGYERFQVLAQYLEEPDLKTFYIDLAKREKGHYKIFVNIALKYFSDSDVQEAIVRIANDEHEAMLQSPLSGRLH